MTRINCIPAAELTGPHLVAEYRELPRIFGLVRKRVAKGQKPADIQIPESYRLGAGHVLFFYDKLGWLVARQRQLIEEMQNRQYEPQFTDPDQLLAGIPDCWRGDWTPTADALELNRTRIQERLG